MLGVEKLKQFNGSFYIITALMQLLIYMGLALVHNLDKMLKVWSGICLELRPSATRYFSINGATASALHEAKWGVMPVLGTREQIKRFNCPSHMDRVHLVCTSSLHASIYFEVADVNFNARYSSFSLIEVIFVGHTTCLNL